MLWCTLKKTLIIIGQKYSPTVAISAAAKRINSFSCKVGQHFQLSLNLLDNLHADHPLFELLFLLSHKSIHCPITAITEEMLWHLPQASLLVDKVCNFLFKIELFVLVMKGDEIQPNPQNKVDPVKR